MSYAKAHDILKLADFARARHRGVTLEEIRDEFGVSHRTAQRMTDALESLFPYAVNILEDDDRRRRWTIDSVALAALRLRGDTELAALEMAIERMRVDGDLREASALSALRNRLLAALRPQDARRAEADAEALLEAHGMAARPGPVVEVDPDLAELIASALRGPFVMDITYNDERRRVEPYGILIGARRYLVARQPDRTDGRMRYFRLDLIRDALLVEESFARDPNFSLRDHAARAFGTWQNDAEYGEVIWHFTPEAAARAREWRFHPAQVQRDLPDGGLEVRFHAGGWLEMTWHLYQWGAEVTVIAPPQLRAMVEGHGRTDFPVLP